jgi:hypothetical protein
MAAGCRANDDYNPTHRQHQERKANVTRVKHESHFSDGIYIIEVDGCQYVWAKSGYGAGLTHKGNCSNH